MQEYIVLYWLLLFWFFIHDLQVQCKKDFCHYNVLCENMNKTIFSSSSFLVNSSTSRSPGAILRCVFVHLAARRKGLEPCSKSQMWKLSLQGRPRLSALLSNLGGSSLAQPLQYGQKDDFSWASEVGQHPSGGTTRALALWIGKKAQNKAFVNVLTMPLGFSPPDFIIWFIPPFLLGR